MGGLLLVLLAAALFLPGLATLPPIDRDEPRFAQASYQMARSDQIADWVTPRVQGELRLNKPPLIYWLQGGVARLLDPLVRAFPAAGSVDVPPQGEIWVYRVPSLIAALATVLITWRIGCDMFSPQVAWLGAAAVAASVVVCVDARLARADQTLLAFTTLAMWALWRIWRSRSAARGGWFWPVVLWFAVALGVLTKGPITPAVVAVTALTLSLLERDARWLLRLRPLLGLLVVIGLVAPWVAAIGQAVGWRRFAGVIVDEVLRRATTGREGHAAPPGYHLLLLPVLLWPSAAFLVHGVVRGLFSGLRFPEIASRARGSLATRLLRVRTRRPADAFLLAWAIPVWLMFEIAVTKLPHYPLPMYPALALLCARAACLPREALARMLPARTQQAILAGWLMLGLLIAASGPALVLSLGDGSLRNGAIAVALGGGVAALVACAAWCARVGANRGALGLGVAAATAAAWLLFDWTPRHTDALWGSARAAAMLRAADPDAARPWATAGFDEDSLIFLLRGRVERITPFEAESWLQRHPDGLLVLRELDALRQPSLDRIASFRTFNYSNGHWLTLSLARAAPAAAGR